MSFLSPLISRICRLEKIVHDLQEQVDALTPVDPVTYSLYSDETEGGVWRLNDGDPMPGDVVIDDGADWAGFSHVEGDTWTASGNRLYQEPLDYKLNADLARVLPTSDAILFHVGITGQSLSIGGPVAVSTTPVHSGYNLMFSVGSRAGAGVPLNGATLTDFVDLVEYGNTESPASGTLNRLQTRNQEIMGSRVRMLASGHGQGGAFYTAIKKGTQSYTNGITEVTRAKDVALGLGWKYTFPAMLMIHGEADEGIGTPAATYDGYMKQLTNDLAADIKPITGQLFDPILVQSQVGSWTAPAYNHATPTAALGQLSAALTDDRIILAGPKYHMTYNADGIHLPGANYRLLGEYLCKALEQTLFGKGKWFPLYPISAVQNAGDVTVTFHVPVGPLVFDTTLVSNPGNLGFELAGATISGTPSIVGNTVVIPKTGTATAVRYAYTGIPGNSAGPLTGPRGNLRDSDPQISLYTADHLYNWCVHFSMAL